MKARSSSVFPMCFNSRFPPIAQDFSDMVANKAAQQKRKAAERKESGKSKKQKDSFQF